MSLAEKCLAEKWREQKWQKERIGGGGKSEVGNLEAKIGFCG
jgi:hypothetical protein